MNELSARLQAANIITSLQVLPLRELRQPREPRQLRELRQLREPLLLPRELLLLLSEPTRSRS